MKIGFVVQRYGLEVSGGAELEARLLAEHLSPYVQVEVLTTCALDYMTWANHYPAGLTQVNGIPVHRFPVQSPRDVTAFNRFSTDILARPHSRYDEIRWMELQGPNAPTLFDFLCEYHHRYDLLLFFTYLYATTFWGLQIAPFKSILFPTAHDEEWIYFEIFRTVFHLPRGFIFNSPEEDLFVRTLFHNEHIPGIALGVGVEIPPHQSSQVIKEPYLLYLGRIDQSKGCDELFRYFLRYKGETHDPIKLVLIGSQAMPIPDHPDIVFLGFMKEERFGWLERAELLILPSPHESLSLATLEAWALGVPVLVNATAAVLKSHCLRGQGGLYYSTEDDFIAALRLLRSDSQLRVRLGAQGKAYVEREYRWERIEKAYVEFFRKMYDLVYASPSCETKGGSSAGAFATWNTDRYSDQSIGIGNSNYRCIG